MSHVFKAGRDVLHFFFSTVNNVLQFSLLQIYLINMLDKNAECLGNKIYYRMLPVLLSVFLMVDVFSALIFK